MKSRIVFISIGFLFHLVPCFSMLYYEGGSGAPDNPYRIRTAQQFNTIGLHPEHWRKHFILMEDLDFLALADEPFHPVGTDEWNQRFSGVFDGNGHTLSNFRFAAENSDPVGLFVTVTGTIRNLTLIGVNVHNGIGNRTGSLAGRLHFGHVVNCHVQGEIVSGRRAVGGLIGENHGGVLTYCSADCQVAGEQDVGGLVGDTQGGILQYSFASGPVIAAGDHSGGLAGQNYSSLIQNCYSIGDVEGNDFCGGLVGRNFSGSVVDCYAMGAVAGRMEIGGLVGRNLEKGAIFTSFSAGPVFGEKMIGGLVGSNNNHCGYKTPHGTIRDSFWDMETSGCQKMCGDKQAECDNSHGKTTQEMRQRGTYVNWDFMEESSKGTVIWRLCEEGVGYPRLVWEFGPDYRCPEGVSLEDLLYLAGHWLQPAAEAFPLPDPEGMDDRLVNLEDFSLLAEQWMK